MNTSVCFSAMHMYYITVMCYLLAFSVHCGWFSARLTQVLMPIMN